MLRLFQLSILASIPPVDKSLLSVLISAVSQEIREQIAYTQLSQSDSGLDIFLFVVNR
jgi:hypothetical protein